jgi:hypothetical protein
MEAVHGVRVGGHGARQFFLAQRHAPNLLLEAQGRKNWFCGLSPFVGFDFVLLLGLILRAFAFCWF